VERRCIEARIEEEERLSVRIYNIGQSRDSRCQYKFNEDFASVEDKDFIFQSRHSAAHGV